MSQIPVTINGKIKSILYIDFNHRKINFYELQPLQVIYQIQPHQIKEITQSNTNFTNIYLTLQDNLSTMLTTSFNQTLYRQLVEFKNLENIKEDKFLLKQKQQLFNSYDTVFEDFSECEKNNQVNQIFINPTTQQLIKRCNNVILFHIPLGQILSLQIIEYQQQFPNQFNQVLQINTKVQEYNFFKTNIQIKFETIYKMQEFIIILNFNQFLSKNMINLQQQEEQNRINPINRTNYVFTVANFKNAQSMQFLQQAAERKIQQLISEKEVAQDQDLKSIVNQQPNNKKTQKLNLTNKHLMTQFKIDQNNCSVFDKYDINSSKPFKMTDSQDNAESFLKNMKASIETTKQTLKQELNGSKLQFKSQQILQKQLNLDMQQIKHITSLTDEEQLIWNDLHEKMTVVNFNKIVEPSQSSEPQEEVIDVHESLHTDQDDDTSNKFDEDLNFNERLDFVDDIINNDLEYYKRLEEKKLLNMQKEKENELLQQIQNEQQQQNQIKELQKIYNIFDLANAENKNILENQQQLLNEMTTTQIQQLVDSQYDQDKMQDDATNAIINSKNNQLMGDEQFTFSVSKSKEPKYSLKLCLFDLRTQKFKILRGKFKILRNFDLQLTIKHSILKQSTNVIKGIQLKAANLEKNLINAVDFRTEVKKYGKNSKILTFETQKQEEIYLLMGETDFKIFKQFLSFQQQVKNSYLSSQNNNEDDQQQNQQNVTVDDL